MSSPLDPKTAELFAELSCSLDPEERGLSLERALTFEEIKKLLMQIASSRLHGNQFVVGDLIVYGDTTSYRTLVRKQAEQTTKKSQQSISKLATTCERILPHERTFDCRYTHYEEVANKKTLSLDDRLFWLKQSASEQWSLQTLQSKVRTQKITFAPPVRSRKKRDSAANYEFGAETNFRKLCHAPTTEQGVAVLFGVLSNELGYSVEGIRAAYPTCKAAEMRSGRTVFIGFEVKSSRFKKRRLKGQKCDLIVCWEHDCPRRSIEVLCLRETGESGAGEKNEMNSQ